MRARSSSAHSVGAQSATSFLHFAKTFAVGDVERFLPKGDLLEALNGFHDAAEHCKLLFVSALQVASSDVVELLKQVISDAVGRMTEEAGPVLSSVLGAATRLHDRLRSCLVL